MGKIVSIPYLFARIKSRIRGKQELVKYFRRHGVNMADNANCGFDIVTPEPYLITVGEGTTISYDVDFITHDNSLSKLGIGYSDAFGQITIGKIVS